MAYTKQAAVSPSFSAAQVLPFTAPPGVGAGNGDAIPIGSSLVVIVGATPTTLTFKVPITYEGLTITSPTLTLPINATYILGPFNEDPFGVQAGTDTGYVEIDYSSITAVTRAVVFQP